MSLTTVPTGKSDALMLPPPPRAPKRKKVVLEEDEYVSRLEAILERDFFPELSKLKNKLEWVTAVNSGDMNLVRQAQINIAKRRAGLQTPMYTGATPSMSTPHTAMFRTPAMTPLSQGVSATPAGASHSQPHQQQQPSHAELKAPSMTLDDFLSKYTSEDNASFEQLQDDIQKRKDYKHAHHLLEKPAPYVLPNGRPSDELLLTAGDQPQYQVVHWKHTARNPHFFDSSNRLDAPLSDKELAERAMVPPKQINYNGTRLAAEEEPPPAEQEAPQQPLPAGEAAELPEALAGMHPKGAPGTQGYNYMPTPSPAPGVEESPFMTWGMLGSTPLRLDGDDDLNLDLSDMPGPQFRISAPTIREQAAQALGQRAGARQKASKTPVVHRPGTGPRLLSEAGKKLASVLRGSGSGLAGVDSQLRSSYTPGSRSRGASQHSTPRLALGGTPVPGAAGVQVKASRKEAKQAGGAGAGAGNVTDGLLKL
jgi:protein DGCR14